MKSFEKFENFESFMLAKQKDNKYILLLHTRDCNL